MRGAGYTKVQMKAPEWYLQAKDYEAWKASQSASDRSPHPDLGGLAFGRDEGERLGMMGRDPKSPKA